MQVHVITDREDNEWIQAIKKEGEERKGQRGRARPGVGPGITMSLGRKNFSKLVQKDYTSLFFFWYTVELPITDPPRSGQPLYNRQTLWHRLNLS